MKRADHLIPAQNTHLQQLYQIYQADNLQNAHQALDRTT